MPVYAEKNMRYAHIAEICEKRGNMRNMGQSQIRVKLQHAELTSRRIHRK